MASKLAWILTHFQAGFQSHSSQGCNTEERQDSVTHNVYSQQGGAHSTTGLALGCGKELHGEAKAAAHSSRLKLTRHTYCTYTPSKTVTQQHTGNTLSELPPTTYPCYFPSTRPSPYFIKCFCTISNILCISLQHEILKTTKWYCNSQDRNALFLRSHTLILINPDELLFNWL